MELIAYYRVSTKDQGESGLGLKAQQGACEHYARSNGGIFIQTYTEIESGANDERPELAKAIAACRRSRARLVVAKLDRLSRDAAYTTDFLKNSGIEIVVCDSPGADKMMLQMKAVVSEYERDLIARRTRESLAVFKAEKRIPRRFQKMYPDGVPAEIVERYAGKLGSANPDVWEKRRGSLLKSLAHARERSNRARREMALRKVADLMGEITTARDSGDSLQAIADRLNAKGHRSPGGCAWRRPSVRRVLLMARAA